MSDRFIGIDLGAETIKLVELIVGPSGIAPGRRQIIEHHKDPAGILLEALRDWDWSGISGAAVVGRLGRLLGVLRVPTKQAQSRGFRFLHGHEPATVVSIGSHGFSVLELRASGVEILRENSRCSQGTGNFLRQLVERFDLSIEEASARCEDVEDPAPLSGRCPVILKTDMTHLANKGVDQARILAGLYDAVCENVQVLIKPAVSPSRVLLTGGVSRSERVRRHFRRFLERHGMQFVPVREDDALFLDAIGCALVAAERPLRVPDLDALIAPREEAKLERLSPLSDSLHRVRRMERPEASVNGERELVLGFDIGSTGSKVVALDRRTKEIAWEGYVSTNGNPVQAAQSLMRQFVDGPAGRNAPFGFGVTGSGREIVGSLLSTCYGVERVYVLNEIAAHAEGALHHDRRVDTIFEIGGQDAKYIRLAGGRVVDAAMNEACSAGTGSFIEEQGSKFSGIRDVTQLGVEALLAESGVSLGQHCSVFMAEVIDQAVASGVETRAVIAGIYDSIIQNYLNRVKGARSVGQVVFCQGMPFSSDALAAAVARQTGSEVIVPPNPGMVGALGIALLTLGAIPGDIAPPVDPSRFLGAKVVRKDTFVCKSRKGCGGAGNCCRVDRLTTLVGSSRRQFTWGGSCSLWDRGTGKRKLPDLAPDPFRERQALLEQLARGARADRDCEKVAMSDEFQLKELFPFFATFLRELGFDVIHRRSAGQETLKRGIEEANVPFCAPMQLYHGLFSSMADGLPDYLFSPMLRELPRQGCGTDQAVTCPIVQASPDLLRCDLGERARPTLVTPLIEFGDGDLESRDFLESCRRVAASFGAARNGWRRAFEIARDVQLDFQSRCRDFGRRALDFCRENDIIPVVVLGRPYTIHNRVLNSNVPPLLREQGAMPIPVDCYPVGDDVPTFSGLYWGQSQRNMRAAHQVRRTPGIYSVWCSNYSCGPDSFNLHFYAYAMEGKPFAVIETDGHSGDAGTKTRVEAFLYCVREDLDGGGRGGRERDLRRVARRDHGLPEIRQRGEIVLIPRMGPAAPTMAACLRGIGVRAESLPMPDGEALRIGRRYTSGKECVPMCITLGSLLQRLERERDSDRRFAFLMPTADGPCRLGVYNFLNEIVLENLDWSDRVSIWGPNDANYFEGLPGGSAAFAVTGFVASDMLLDALHDSRPVEASPGAAEEIYTRYFEEMLRLFESRAGRGLSLPAALAQVARGSLFGVADLLRRAATEFAAIKTERAMPTVLLVGENYVRCDPFANDSIVEKLESRGLRVRMAPLMEWIEYVDYIAWITGRQRGLGARLSRIVQHRIQDLAHNIMAERLGWPARTTVPEAVGAARGYLRRELEGEAVVVVGGPVHEWRAGRIDGVVNVGPLECMPTKIAEAQFFHITEREGLSCLTLAINGDPVDAELLDGFAFDVHAGFRERNAS